MVHQYTFNNYNASESTLVVRFFVNNGEMVNHNQSSIYSYNYLYWRFNSRLKRIYLVK